VNQPDYCATRSEFFNRIDPKRTFSCVFGSCGYVARPAL
jgi:hypothetical protein